MKWWKKSFLMASVFMLLISSLVTTVSAEEVNDGANMDITEEEQELIEIFSAIESIPDDVLEKGDSAIADWLRENTDVEFQEQGDVVTFGIVGCASAVGTAILTNAIPFTKLAKVKSAIKSAGGATTFVKSLVPAYKSARKAGSSKSAAVKKAVNKAASNAGPETKRALLDLFNLGNVYSSCFE